MTGHAFVGGTIHMAIMTKDLIEILPDAKALQLRCAHPPRCLSR
jgi:hypothetical protein